MTRFVFVTGTSTDVGKTVVTAALAASTPGRVAVVKPVQTGVLADDAGDADAVHRLAAVPVYEFVRLRDPLAPDTAARREGVDLPPVAELAARIAELAAGYDVVFVEGAGGLLVHLDAERGTIMDLADSLPGSYETSWVVVCAAGLGTLNHTELTVRALEERGARDVGLVIGSWPAAPGLAEECNREDLPAIAPVRGVVPAGVGALEPEEFRAQSAGWFTNQR